MSESFRITEHYDRSRLDQFQFMRRIVKWADKVGPEFRAELQRQAPIGDPLTDTHPGRLRGSIRYSRHTTERGVRIDWTAHTPYTPYVLHGTGEHEIWAKAALALHFRDAHGSMVFRQHVVHRGARANDFADRAGDRMRARMRRSFRDAVRGE